MTDSISSASSIPSPASKLKRSTGIIRPIWPAPENVVAGVTTRGSGHSQAPFDQFNIAPHVGDNSAAVTANRDDLANDENLAYPQKNKQWQWLKQTHSTDIKLIESVQTEPLQADATFTNKNATVCTVMTADCLPILLCDASGSRVAAIHAGWRGLANGIIDESITAFCGAKKSTKIHSQAIYAWLGPAIGPDHFEVGQEVKDAFKVADTKISEKYAAAFTQKYDQHYLADIYQLATIALNACGVNHIYGGGFCTVCESDRFFSYRRDGQTGRMASYIYLNHQPS